ncbi:MAG TPA: hypothetical protein VHU80_13560, partial [Polyangiaceae bacterium]|nr:hypothetical protein [Polyangiaceae bacterium]
DPLAAKGTALDVRRLAEVLAGTTVAASDCYAPRWAADPGLWGRLGLRVDVDRHGNVTVREHESRFPDPEVVRCAKAAVEALPLASIVTAPSSFTWGLRFGSPRAAAPIPAENKISATAEHSTVADPPAPRLPMAP